MVFTPLRSLAAGELMDDAVNKVALHLHALLVVFGGKILLLVALTTMLCSVILVQVNDELIA